MVRSVTIPEAEWSPDDVALLLASRLVEADRGPHGFSMAEATDPANEGKFHGKPVPRVDYAEKARLDAQDAYYKQWDKPDNPVNRHGHIWGVTKEPIQ